MKKDIINILIGMTVGSIVIAYLSRRSSRQMSKKIDKFKSYYQVLNQWFSLKQEGKSLECYFLANNYQVIAIYGMGEMGNRLYKELKETSITVEYVIDREIDNVYAEVDVYKATDDLPEVDAIIVTAFFDFSEIRHQLSEKVDYDIISLEDIIYG